MFKERGPNFCVAITDGVNCNDETSRAIKAAGGNPRTVHVNELRSGDAKLDDFEGFVLSGGFSHGDDAGSGTILATELKSYLGDKIYDFIQRKKGLVLGVCNGFQVLTRTGLLPFGKMGEMQATLAPNDSGHFVCRWIDLKVEGEHACVFLKGMEGTLSLQVAHGEGRFYAREAELARVESGKLVVFRYCDAEGNPTQEYPTNPNGSLNAIAGITDPSGRILGLMPHPERFIRRMQHPNARRDPSLQPQGITVFEGMVKYAKEM